MKKTKKLTTIAMMTAAIIVLQVIATFINFGGFPITLTLIPIVVAGALYGPAIGSLMGLVFGIIVSLMVVVGADANGAAMLSMHPFITITACLLKGVLAGLVSSLVYKLLEKANSKAAIIGSAFSAPVVNTGVLYFFLIMFFNEDYSSMLAAFMSTNFVMELVINLLLSPGLLRVIKILNRED